MMNRTTTAQKSEFEDLRAALGEEPEAQPLAPAPEREIVLKKDEITIKETKIKAYDARKGTLHAEVTHTMAGIVDGEFKTSTHKFDVHATLDDGRVCQGLGDFNQSVHTGQTFTNASAKDCPGCEQRTFKRELSPSSVHPDMCVCPDCHKKNV